MREVSLTTRHEIKSAITGKTISESIFGETVENPLDFETMRKTSLLYLHNCIWDDVTELHLYITGLTPATTTFLKVFLDAGSPFKLVLYHYNRDTSSYVPQVFFD